MGRSALANNTGGSANVAIGHQAGLQMTGSTNVAIGNNAGSAVAVAIGDSSESPP